MKLNLLHYILKYTNLYLLYFNIFFLLFQLFLSVSSTYLFNGDVYHGVSSYLLIVHSALAISSVFLYYHIIIICSVYLLNQKLLTRYLSTIIDLIFFISVFVSFHILIFIFTGLVWGDYAWGLIMLFEYRMFKLCLLLLLHGIIIYAYFKKKYILLNTYAIILFILIVFMFFDIFFIGTSNESFEIHQNERSIHLFLISISGSYMFSIFIFTSYLLILLIGMIISFLFDKSNKNSDCINKFYYYNSHN